MSKWFAKVHVVLLIVASMVLIGPRSVFAQEVFDTHFGGTDLAEIQKVWTISKPDTIKDDWTVESRQGTPSLESPGEGSSVARPIPAVDHQRFSMVIEYGWRAGRAPGAAELRIGNAKHAIIISILQQRGDKYRVRWSDDKGDKDLGVLKDTTLDAGVQAGGVAMTPAFLHLSLNADRTQLQLDRLGGGIVQIPLPQPLALEQMTITDRSPTKEGYRISRIRAYSGDIDPVSVPAEFSFPFGATFIESTETPVMRLLAKWFSDEVRQAKLSGTVTEVDGDPSKQTPFEVRLELKPRTQPTIKADALTNLSPGLYQVQGQVQIGDIQLPLNARFSILSKDLASRDQEAIPQWVGMVPAFNVLPRGIYGEGFEYLEKIGVRHLRWLPGWGRLEPVENKYEWDETDEFVDLAIKHKMETMFCFSYYGGDWTQVRTNGTLARTPEGRAMWVEKFAVPVVKRYGDRVKLYQIWNEPDAFWNDDPAKATGFSVAFATPSNYFDLLKRTHEAVHALNIEGVRVMASLSSGEITRNTKLLLDMGLKDIFDGMIIHTYGNHPRHFVQLRNQLEKAGIKDPQIGSGETGLPRSDGDESSSMRQAMKVVNVLFSSTTIPAPLCVEWFVLQDKVAGGNFGMLDETFEPHPAATAFATAARLLSGATTGTMEEKGNLNFYRVERNGRPPVIAISNPGVPVLITLKSNGPAPVVWDMLGRRSMPQVRDGKVDVTVEHALMIEGDVAVETSMLPSLKLTIGGDGKASVAIACGADAAGASATIRIEELKYASDGKLDDKGQTTFALPDQIEAGKIYPAELTLNVRGSELKRTINVEINRIQQVTDAEAEALMPPDRLRAIAIDTVDSFRPFNKKRVWGGVADNSAKVRFGWTDKLLVLWVEQQDDIQFAIPPQVPNPFGYDSGQWGFQSDGQLEPGAPITDIVFGIMKDGKPIARVMGQPHFGPAVIAQREGTTTRYRVTIPASQLGIEAKPGTSFGMALNINDNDGDGRKGWMFWGQGINGQRNASLFRRVVLESKPSAETGK